MAYSRPLGSFIPDPVAADVLSFLSKSNVLDFNLISPRAHYIVCEYKVISRDYASVDVTRDRGNIKYYSAETEKDPYIHIWQQQIEITRDRIFSFLSVCRSIKSMEWGMDVDYVTLNMLNTKNIKEIKFAECKIFADPEAFGSFLKNLEKPMSLSKVVMDNKLITNETLRKMENVNIFSSWSRDRQSSEHRRCSVDDDHLRFLNENYSELGLTHRKRNRFKLTGFLTDFTIASIKKLIQGEHKFLNFGILYRDQLSDAITLAKNNEKETTITLHSWNGHATIKFELNLWNDYERTPNFKPMFFEVSLSEISEGQVEMVHPVDLMSSDTFMVFKALNEGSRLTITYILSAKPDDSNTKKPIPETRTVTLVRTDVTVEDTIKIIKHCIRHFGYIANLKLMLSGCREPNNGNVVRPLNDKLLFKLAAKGYDAPNVFTLTEFSHNTFTIEGLQTIIEALTAQLGNRNFYYTLGIIPKESANKVHDWLQNLEWMPSPLDQKWELDTKYIALHRAVECKIKEIDGGSIILFSVPPRTVEDPKIKTVIERKKRIGEPVVDVLAKNIKL